MKLKQIFLSLLIIISAVILVSCFNSVKTGIDTEEEILRIREAIPYKNEEEREEYIQAMLMSLFDNLPSETSGSDEQNSSQNESSDEAASSENDTVQADGLYIMNKKSKKFHKASCSSSSKIKENNYGESSDRNWLISNGYQPCKQCNP